MEDQKLNQSKVLNNFSILKFESADKQQILTWEEALDLLKIRQIRERDIRMLQKSMEIEENFSRQIVASRPTSNAIIFMLEHFKVQ